MRDFAGQGRFQRGEWLFQFQRYELAVKEFRAATAAAPNDPFAPAMLAFSLAAQSESKEAIAAAREAVRRGPDVGFAYQALGVAFFVAGRHEDAGRAGLDALRLDPQYFDAHLLIAQVEGACDRWLHAYQSAKAALALAPLDDRAAAITGEALVRLGQQEKAVLLLMQSLHHSPESSALHEVLGFALLHVGNETEALSHLKEALRLSPSSDTARMFLREALKSRNRLYRSLLNFSLWFGRKRRLKATVLAAAFMVYAIVMAMAAVARSGLLPWLAAAFGVILALLIWQQLSVPLFDILLRFDSLGRHVVSRQEKLGGNVVVGCLAGAVASAIVAVAYPIFLIVAIPTATVFPWLLYSTVMDPPGQRRQLRFAFIIPSVLVAETGLVLAALSDPFRIEALALAGCMFIALSPLVFVFGGLVLIAYDQQRGEQ